MGKPAKGRRGQVGLIPEVSLLVDAEWLEETFKILNEASDRAKGAAGTYVYSIFMMYSYYVHYENSIYCV
jgi:hypothetical protein